MADGQVRIEILASSKELIQETQKAIKGLQPFQKILDAVADIKVDPKNAEGAFKRIAQSGKLSADALDAAHRAMNSVLAETDRLLLAGVSASEIRQRAYQAATQVAIGYSSAEEAVAAGATEERLAMATGASATQAKAQADQVATQAANAHGQALIGVAAAGQRAGTGLGGLIEQMGKLGLATQYIQQFAQTAQRIGGALEEAAQASDIEQSFLSLARSSGVVADDLIRNMQRASRDTVAEVDLMRSANRALLAGGAVLANDLPRLFEIARASAKATGQDVGYVFETLVKGIVKASPLLIDNAEVYVKIGGAVDEYAAKLGKTSKELTIAEQQHAILNAVLQQGGEFIQRIGADADSAADKYARSRVAVQEFKQSMGEFLDSLGPVGPALQLIGEAATTLAPILLAVVAAKQAGIKASLAGTIAYAKETAAMIGQAAAAKGLIGSRLAGGLGAAGAGALAIAAPVAAAYAWYKVGEKVIAINKDIDKSTKEVGDRWNTFLDDQATKAANATDVVEAYRAKQEAVREELYRDGGALEDVSRALIRAKTGTKLMRADTEELHQTLIAAAGGYDDYVAAVNRFNADLAKGEREIALVSQAIFEFQRKMADGTATLNDLADVLEERSNPLLGAMAESLRKIQDSQEATAAAEAERKARQLEASEITAIANEALRDLALTEDELEEAERELALAVGETTEAKLKATDQVTLLTQAYALGIISLSEYTQAMKAAKAGTLALTEANLEELRSATEAAQQRRAAKDELVKTFEEMGQARLELTEAEIKARQKERQEEAEHQERMVEIARKAAQERLQAAQKLQSALTQAAEQHQRAIENAERNHRQRVQDIEREHRQRLEEIERNYTKTVREAAITRDALAILQARERRTEEIDEANRTRDEALENEDRSFQDSLRQAEQAYRDQVVAAQRAYQEQLAALAQRIQEEEARERERAAKQRGAQNQELEEARAHYRRLEVEYQQHLIRMRGIQSRYGRWGGSRGGVSPGGVPIGAAPEQHGGTGIVRGPATFSVGAGEREAFWFSGDLRGRQQPQTPFLGPQPQAATVPASFVQINGRVGVDLTGFSDRLIARIGPTLQQSISAAVLDEIAAVFEEA